MIEILCIAIPKVFQNSKQEKSPFHLMQRDMILKKFAVLNNKRVIQKLCLLQKKISKQRVLKFR